MQKITVKSETLSKITLRFHPIMQDSDDRNPIGCDSKINHVALDTTWDAERPGLHSFAARGNDHQGPLLRQFQIIHHPIHRQLAEHDQLRDPQQRPAL